MITQDQLERSMHYEQYSKLLKDLMAQGKTTGATQSEKYLEYARLNLQRMQRIEKTTELTEELKAALSKITGQYTWLVITEGWCGDAAQNLPVMHLIEQACPGIKLRLLLRDENLDVMDQYLTNGSRSIPKLICLKKEDNGMLKEIFVWGPRPESAQNLMLALKASDTPHDERSLLIQKWYIADKTLSVQNELLFLAGKL